MKRSFDDFDESLKGALFEDMSFTENMMLECLKGGSFFYSSCNKRLLMQVGFRILLELSNNETRYELSSLKLGVITIVLLATSFDKIETETTLEFYDQANDTEDIYFFSYDAFVESEFTKAKNWLLRRGFRRFNFRRRSSI